MAAPPTSSRINAEMTCIRYMLFVANFMFVLVAMLLLTIGYTIKSIYGNFDVFMEQYHYSPSNLSISIGFLILVVALFGCIAALKRSVFFVNLYTVFLSFILILEIAVFISAYSMRSNIEANIEINMKNAMVNYDSRFYQYTWNATQYNLRCCGVNGPSNWTDIYANYRDLPVVHIGNSPIHVPDTCCQNQTCTDENSLYYTGCLPRLTYVISESAQLLGIGALCVSFIQVLGIIFGLMLAKSIRKLKTELLVVKEMQRQKMYEQMKTAELGKSEEKKSETPILYIPGSSEA